VVGGAWSSISFLVVGRVDGCYGVVAQRKLFMAATVSTLSTCCQETVARLRRYMREVSDFQRRRNLIMVGE